MNVLCDFVGHADLYYSFYLLFEKRLGFNLYRPYGQTWQTKNVRTATLPRDAVIRDFDIFIPSHNYIQRGISLEDFQQADFDIIVCTSWENEKALYSLHLEKQNSIFVRHIANINEIPILSTTKNVLLSTLTPMPNGVNYLIYHPEHSDIYYPDFSYERNYKIKSFTNDLVSYPVDISMWNQLKRFMPNYTFFMHGHNGLDGPIPQVNLSDSIKDAMFVWHVKGNGCCGYTARESLSCGKPLIVNKAYTRIHKTLASTYLVDGFNCIDIDPKVRSLQRAAGILRNWSQPDMYKQVCKNATDTFKKYINFDQEAEQIIQWLNRLH